jgi:hypothetical protein
MNRFSTKGVKNFIHLLKLNFGIYFIILSKKNDVLCASFSQFSPKELFPHAKESPIYFTSFVMLLGQHFQPTNDSSNCNMDVHHMTLFFFLQLKCSKKNYVLSHH